MKDIVHLHFENTEQFPTEKVAEMKLYRSTFLVKNFTDDYIHVTLNGTEVKGTEVTF